MRHGYITRTCIILPAQIALGMSAAAQEAPFTQHWGWNGWAQDGVPAELRVPGSSKLVVGGGDHALHRLCDGGVIPRSVGLGFAPSAVAIMPAEPKNGDQFEPVALVDALL